MVPASMDLHTRIAVLLGGLLALAGCDARPASSPTDATAEACRRCHGSADNAAPPTSVLGLTGTGDVAVGAHQAHVRDTSLHLAIACDACHVVPSQVDSPGHIDGQRALVTFGGIAGARGAQPVWDPAQATCASTYCHGAFPGGAQAVPLWTRVDGTQAACGTCHEMGPTTGHHPVLFHVARGCSACHGGTYSSTTADRALHVNGVVEIGNFIVRWDPVARTCTPACHNSRVW